MTELSQNDVVQSLKEIRELTEKGQHVTAEGKAKIDKLEEIQAKHQEASDELVKKMAILEKEAEEKASKVTELETLLSRAPLIGSDADKKEQAKKEIEIITKAMHRSAYGRPMELTPDEMKYLRSDVDFDGGYLVADEYDTQLIKKLTETSMVRALATVQRVSSKRLNVPKRDTLLTAYWVGEGEPATESNSTYARGTINATKMMVRVGVTNEEIEDAFISIPRIITEDAAEEMGRLEGAAFVSGNGIEKPFGFMTNSEVAISLTGAATAALTVDNLIDLTATPKSGYLGRSVFGMNRATIAYVRKLKNSEGNYLWQDGSVAAGTPNTLLGYPVVEMPDLADIAINGFPVVFGDFRSAYKIIDRIGTSTLVDRYTDAGSDKLRLYVRRRVGGDVVLGEALAKLKCAAS